jgi:hypothetical protein
MALPAPFILAKGTSTGMFTLSHRAPGPQSVYMADRLHNFQPRSRLLTVGVMMSRLVMMRHRFATTSSL